MPVSARLQGTQGAQREGACSKGRHADRPDAIATEIDPDERAAVSRALALVGEAKIAHTLTRDGQTIVPIDGGHSDVALDPVHLNGEWWIDLSIFVRIELGTDELTCRRTRRFVLDESRYYGAKFISNELAGELRVMLDLPLTGCRPRRY